MNTIIRIERILGRQELACWKAVLIVLATLILCSCRGITPHEDAGTLPAPQPSPPLPPQAWSGAPNEHLVLMGARQPDIGSVAIGQWAPPGIARPWPQDEYLRDGGDRNLPVQIAKDWSVRGLDLEDTVVHYDRLDGRTAVAASNRVHIYAPRFAAVRQVSGTLAHQQHQQMAGVKQPVKLARQDDLRIASTVIQPIHPDGQTAAKSPSTFRERLRGVGLENAQALALFDNIFALHEDFQIIRLGIFDQPEKARLASAVEAALAWTDELAVQVVFDNKQAVVSTHDLGPQLTYHYEMPPGKPRLRVVKVASKQNVQPGETIGFTIRYDNVGDEQIGNVTIIDNLTSRLEYMPNTAQSSLPAKFFTQANEGDSLVLRWEVTDPLKPGQGGIVRFNCRVR